MKIELEIDDELFRMATEKAEEEGIRLDELVEIALRQYLTHRPQDDRYRLKWKTEKGRIRPGVDLDDRDALHDLMDGCTDEEE